MRLQSLMLFSKKWHSQPYLESTLRTDRLQPPEWISAELWTSTQMSGFGQRSCPQLAIICGWPVRTVVPRENPKFTLSAGLGRSEIGTPIKLQVPKNMQTYFSQPSKLWSYAKFATNWTKFGLASFPNQYTTVYLRLCNPYHCNQLRQSQRH